MTSSAGQRASPPRSGSRFLTAGEQSRLSWARVVGTFDAVPPAYRAWLGPLVRGREPFPYIVLTPTYEGYLRRESEKLVCLLDGVLHIVERAGDRLAPVSYRLDEIGYVEVGAILLRGWLTVRGATEDGLLTSTTLRYNTVTERLFAPVTKAFRSGARPLTDARLDAERAKFDDLLSRNYKFMNCARDSIMPGESVLGYAFQPEIREPLLRLFGRSVSRGIAPTHIVILADRELIVISEEGGSFWQSLGSARYGSIRTYIPLNRISAASCALREHGRVGLSIHLYQNDRLEILFSPEVGPEVELLAGQLAELP